MSNESKATGSSFMETLATVIVDKRNLIFLLTIILLVFSVFSRNWVEVESDLTYYLPGGSETKQALTIMDEQFTTYGTAEVMVANITPEQAAAHLDRERSLVYSPFLMRDMDKAVARIDRALAGGETIAVFGDYGVGGVPYTCLLAEDLRFCVAAVQ